MPFLIMSRTIGVLLSRKSRVANHRGRQNNAISPEGNVFSEVHTIHVFKSLQETVRHLTLDILTRYVAASAVTDTQTDTHTKRLPEPSCMCAEANYSGFICG